MDAIYRLLGFVGFVEIYVGLVSHGSDRKCVFRVGPKYNLNLSASPAVNASLKSGSEFPSKKITSFCFCDLREIQFSLVAFKFYILTLLTSF